MGNKSLDEALVEAVNIGNTRLVRLLIEAGADAHYEDGWSLRVARSFSNSSEIVQRILSAMGIRECVVTTGLKGL